MSKTLEAIINAPSVVREQWLSPELAVREVLAFERRFGSKHLMLACHAALPLILTPELLNLIHINFLDQEEIPWIAEVDFLLSPLCRPINDGLYEVEPTIREVLLVELENQFGLERPFGLANFLQFYLDHKSGLKPRSTVTLTQRWIAQAYIAPDQVIAELTDLLESSLSEENELFSLSDKIKVTRMLEILTDALQQTNHWGEYQYLVSNSRILAQILYGDEQKLKQAIRQEQAEGNIVASTLRLLSPSIRKQLINERENTEGKLPTLFENIERLFLRDTARWDMMKLYTDLSLAKQKLLRGQEKELTQDEKQYLHVLLFIDEESNYNSLTKEEIEQIETVLNNSNLRLYRYIEIITSSQKNTLRNWKDATFLLKKEYRRGKFSTLRTKIINDEILVKSLCELGITVKIEADVRGYNGLRLRSDVVAVLEGECDIGWSRNSDGSFDLIADLWGVAKKHNYTELINSINQRYAVNKTLAELKSRAAIKLKCPRCDSGQVVKYGTYNYKQNYKCNSCGNQFLES